MTALMWGFNAPVSALADFGFSHGLTRSWTPKTSDLALYDEALVAGIGLLHPMGIEFPSGKDNEAYVRKDRTGKVIDFGGGSKGVEVSNPELLQTMKPIMAIARAMSGWTLPRPSRRRSSPIERHVQRIVLKARRESIAKGTRSRRGRNESASPSSPWSWRVASVPAAALGAG